MANPSKDDRTKAERRFADLQHTAKSVKDYTEAERQAVRAKTARLREQRLDREAAEASAKPTRKPPRSRKKPSA